MPTMQIQESVNVMGYSFPASESIVADGGIVKEVTLAVAKVGALTTRTDDNTGTLTMSPGHGIQTGDRLDLYWAGGSRRGITVGTVATNSVPIDLGSGDNLPPDETDITAFVPQEEEFIFTGNNAAAIAYYSDRVGTIVLAESDETEADFAVMNGTKKSDVWTPSRNATVPTATFDVTKVYFSHGSSTQTATMRALVLFY